MTRRIAAALMTLILLFAIFPVYAAADGTAVYTKGQTICIKKEVSNYDPNDAKTTYPVQTGYMWQIKRDESGQRVELCTKPEHKHQKSCFENGDTICGMEPHAHNSLGACSADMGWVWEVVRDPNYTGWDYDPEEPENYEFSVCSIDPDGVHPMVGIGFALTRPATEEEKEATGNSKTSVLEDSRSLLTNRKGYAYFDGTCAETEPAGQTTWTLTQNTTKFAPGGEYHDAYRPHTVEWKVDVTVHGDGTYTVNNIYDPEDDGVAPASELDIPLPEQGYNKSLRRLVMLHDLVRLNLYIDGRFVPQDIETFDVTITGESGFVDTITMSNGEKGWHYVREGLAPDTYSVSVDLNGYPITYKMGYPNQELTEMEGLKLDADHSNGMVEIHFGVLSNTIKLSSMYYDEDKAIKEDIRYGLYLEGQETPVDEFASGELDSETRIGGEDWDFLWDNYGTESGTVQFVLKQSQVPEYHAISEDIYMVTLRQAAENAEEPYTVHLTKAAGGEKVRYGIDNEQIATFRNARPDFSYCVSIRAYDDAEEPNRIYGGTYAISENGEIIEYTSEAELYIFWDYAREYPEKTRTFLLEQVAAPQGYALSEDKYKVTVSWDAENEKPLVTVERDQNLLARIAEFFSGENIQQDEFGRWIAIFTCAKSDRPEKIINTVELHSLNGERQYITGEEIKYGLFRDSYENGEKPAVEFPNDSISQVNGVIRITSNDWIDLAMNNQNLATNAEKLALLSGESIDITLKQSNVPDHYEDAQEEYVLTLRKADEGSDDQFEVMLSVVNGSEMVRYGENGEQIATFVHNRADLSYCVSIQAQNAETEENLTGGQYALYENEELVAEYNSETVIYEFADLAAETPDAVREFTLKQTAAPNGYELSQDEFKVSVSMKDGKPKVAVEKAQNLLSQIVERITGNGIAQDEFGRWVVIFSNPKAAPAAQTAKVQLTLKSILPVWGSGMDKDSDMETQINKMDYAFLLSWGDKTTDPDGEVGSEQLVLRSGSGNNTGTFKKELPVGTKFKITPLNAEDNLYNVYFSRDDSSATKTIDEYEGEVTSVGTVKLNAQPRFEFKPGNEESSLDMYKVNARDLSQPLAGAKFTLKNGSGRVVEEFTTKSDGYIGIGDLEKGVKYTLKETTAPDGYLKMKGNIEITMNYQYTDDGESKDGLKLIRQDLVVEVTHSDVVRGNNGMYYIKNTNASDVPKTGDTFRPDLWIGLLAVSATGLAALLTDRKRRRRAK